VGFYLQLNQKEKAVEFCEGRIPGAIIFLYLFTGVALGGMALAAFSLLKDLLVTGVWWDQALVYAIIAMLPVYFFIGLRIFAVRKFVAYEDGRIRLGYRLAGWTLRKHFFPTSEIETIYLKNQRPSPNIASREHDDAQYYFRGHWRVGLQLRSGKQVNIDRHTERGALVSIYSTMKGWLNS